MSAAPLTVGVLQTGSVPAELEPRHGAYVDMFERLLQAADPSVSVRLYDVERRTEIPASTDECDGWLVTGSRHGAYEDHAWIPPLEDFLRRAVEAGAPVVGICFGHQILAQALGGRVVKSEKGWGAGVQRYSLDAPAPWMDAEPGEAVAIHAMHQDQVVELPEGARVVGGSAFCPHALLAYGDNAFSMQPHPEFDEAYERALIEARHGRPIPPAVADEALEGLGAPVDAARAGRWIVRFLRHAAEARRQAA